MLMNDAEAPGRRMRIPDGKSLIDLVRYAMSSGELNASRAALSVGVSRRAYSLARKLLMIKARGVLTPAEEEQIVGALRVLEEARDGSFKDAENMSRDVLARHWTGRTRSGEPRAEKVVRARIKQRKRFENTLFAIREACANNDELEVPVSLTADERREFTEMLMESMSSLWHLFSKIRGEAP